MNTKTLDNFLHDEEKIMLLQSEFEAEYINSRKKTKVIGEYKKRKYIKLYYREGLRRKDADFVLLINWPNQISPYHVHDWIELSYVYSGKCKWTVLDKEIELHSGQFILLDTDAPHEVGVTGGDNILINFAFPREYLYDNYFCHLSKDNQITKFMVNALSAQTAHDRYIEFSPRKKEKLKVLIQDLMCEYFEPSFCARDILISYMTLILCELIKDYPNSNGHGVTNDSNMMIASVLRYIDNQYLICTLESTAGFFNMNPNYLTTQLKKYVNKSFKELVLERKFELARRKLIYTNASVRNISADIGYENRSYFNRKFKEFYGMLPGEYRKNKNKVW